MKIKKLVGGFSVLALAICAASGQTINQSGGPGTTFTDVLGDGQGSGNLLRDVSFLTINNTATSFIFTLGINPGGNLATGGQFNYIIGITTGAGAGGDSTQTTAGNPYGRDIDFSSTFGGMTDFIGIFGAPSGGGSAGTPYTSYGYNDYVYGTPGSTGVTLGSWLKIGNVASGEPLSDQPSTSIPNEITVTVPFSDFSDNLSITSGTVIDFDLMSTGTGTSTAYDSLADQSPVQSGTFSNTYQDNETVLDQYTVPEPGILAFAGLGATALLGLRRRK